MDKKRPDLWREFASEVGEARAAVAWARNTTSMMPPLRRWFVRRTLDLVYRLLGIAGAASR